jgi:hypothetical protein
LAKRFCDLKELQEKLYQCIENPRFQLDIVLDEVETVRPVIDLQLFDKVRKIHLRCYDCVASSTLDVDDISLVDTLLLLQY